MSQVTIKINLDLEDCSINVDSLIGTIEINDGLHAIVDNATFLDSWLYALIHGLVEIQIKSHCEVNLIDEPDPLAFDSWNGKLAITYKNITVVADSRESFAASLKEAVSSFLRVIESETGNELSEMLEEIRRFTESRFQDPK
jgi:hypothetical protein